MPKRFFAAASVREHSLNMPGTWLLAIVLAVAVLVPLFLSVLPPLADFPNHLARMYVLLHLPESPQLQLYYRNIVAAQPNQAMEAIVLPLAHVMPLEIAGKIFAGLSLLVMAAGTLALHRVLHGRWSVWPCLAFLFLYNRLFLWGFVAYLFTLGCALGAAAAWIGTRDRAATLRILVTTCCATLVYLGHLYAFGVYLLIVAGYELMRVLRDGDVGRLPRDIVIGIISVAPAMALFLLVSPTSAAAGSTYWGEWIRKVEAPADIIFNYNLWVDVACLAIILAFAGHGLWRGRVRFDGTMGVALLLLCLAFVAMPDKLFSSFGADQRLPIAITLTAIAACDWQPRRTWWHEPASFVLAAIFAVRMVVIGVVWHQADGVYREAIAAIDLLPRDIKLLPVIAHDSGQSLPAIPEFEIANMAIIRKEAFVPGLFASPRDAGQTVAFTPLAKAMVDHTLGEIILPKELERLKDPAYIARLGPFRPQMLGEYDYAFVIDGPVLPALAAPPKEAMRLYARGNLEIIRLSPEAPPSP
jgi:hypothetical protein